MRILIRLLPLLCFAGFPWGDTLVAQQPGSSAIQAEHPWRIEPQGLESRGLVPLPRLSRSSASSWPVEGRTRPEDGPMPQRWVGAASAESSIRRYIGWGALAGAGLGVVSSLLVYSACGHPCEGTLAAGVAIHVGLGALAGGAAGALVYWIRQE